MKVKCISFRPEPGGHPGRALHLALRRSCPVHRSSLVEPRTFAYLQGIFTAAGRLAGYELLNRPEHFAGTEFFLPDPGFSGSSGRRGFPQPGCRAAHAPAASSRCVPSISPPSFCFNRAYPIRRCASSVPSPAGASLSSRNAVPCCAQRPCSARWNSCGRRASDSRWITWVRGTTIFWE
jgi:hypothetical protein